MGLCWKIFGEQTLTSAEVVSEGHSGANGNEEELLVIGADTLVAVDGLILGKPADPKDAAEMLRRLSDRRHQVYTGVTLYHHSRAEPGSIHSTSVRRYGFIP